MCQLFCYKNDSDKDKCITVPNVLENPWIALFTSQEPQASQKETSYAFHRHGFMRQL